MQPLRVREDGEDERAQQPLAQRPRHLLLDPLARELDQPVVLHARRARGQAGHAAEAAVEVLGDRAVQLDRPVERRLHQPDPAARRVHLLVPELVGRARRQAEAAVHAVVDQARDPSGEHPFRVERCAHPLGERRPGRARRAVDVGDPGPGPGERGTPASRTAPRPPAATWQRSALVPDRRRRPALPGHGCDLRGDRRLRRPRRGSASRPGGRKSTALGSSCERWSSLPERARIVGLGDDGRLPRPAAGGAGARRARSGRAGRASRRRACRGRSPRRS